MNENSSLALIKPAPTYASREEVVTAINALSDGDRKKLIVASRFWWKKFGLQYSALNPEDLLQEAIYRALKNENSRNWPKHISFVKFLSRGMESIAGHHREKLATENNESFPTQESGDIDSKIQAQKEIKQIQVLFGDGSKAFDVLVLKAQGLDTKEIMAELKMNDTEWETTRKQIQRKLAQYLNQHEEK
ncbi:MAG: hypothetical protein AB7N80_13215 [Bdellovibrionales bacterium]